MTTTCCHYEHVIMPTYNIAAFDCYKLQKHKGCHTVLIVDYSILITRHMKNLKAAMQHSFSQILLRTLFLEWCFL